MQEFTVDSRVFIWCVLVLRATNLATCVQDFTVTCTESEQCVLPCHFQSDGKGARIMWYRKGMIVSCTRYGDTSFVIGSNAQVDSYKGRTGLFTEQVLEGNAALTLRNITPHDQDKYFCVTMTDKVTGQSGVVSLLIRAPVRRVHIGFSDGAVTCSSKGIYPRPSLVWSVDPLPETGRLKNLTTVSETHQGFYDIQSSLQLKDAALYNKTFMCRVATDISHKTAFLKTQESVLACPRTSVTVPCAVLLKSTSYNVSWTFRQWDQILSITVSGKERVVNVDDRWKPHVSVNAQSGALTLVQVQKELQGTYRCEVNSPEETHVTYTELTVQHDLPCVVSIVSSVCCSLLLVVIVIIFTIKRKTFTALVGKCNDQQGAADQRLNADELQKLQSVNQSVNVN